MNKIKNNIDSLRLSPNQYLTILICFFLNVIDGVDVLIMSYTSPVISSDWSISSDTLGVVFSSGLLGMAIGALLLAPQADYIGRKKIILISIIIISLGVFFTGLSKNIYHLIVLRFFSGIGIGAMLATTASIVSECTPSRSKDFWISLILAGYPIGAMIAGYVSNIIIDIYSWEYVFFIFGAISLIFIPIVYFLMSESIVFLKINKTKNQTVPLLSLFSKTYFTQTLKLWMAFFFSFGCLYFLISWIPKLVTETGLSLKLGIYSGAIFNLGAFFGIITQGYFSSKFGLKKTISSFLFLTGVIMILIDFFVGSDLMLIIFGILGFAIQGGFVGLYSVAARIYPSEFRTTGIGWGIGVGRLGAVIGPLCAGFFIASGLGFSANFIIFSIPAFISSIITYYISMND